jgi:hypothetical protein
VAMIITVVFDDDKEGEKFLKSLEQGTRYFIDDFDDMLGAPSRVLKTEFAVKE